MFVWKLKMESTKIRLIKPCFSWTCVVGDVDGRRLKTLKIESGAPTSISRSANRCYRNSATVKHMRRRRWWAAASWCNSCDLQNGVACPFTGTAVERVLDNRADKMGRIISVRVRHGDNLNVIGWACTATNAKFMLKLKNNFKFKFNRK